MQRQWCGNRRSRGARDERCPLATRELGGGRLQLKGMLSADPWTVGGRGYPLLLQTGETFQGVPILDRQHPHDLFMELAGSYEHAVSERGPPAALDPICPSAQAARSRTSGSESDNAAISDGNADESPALPSNDSRIALESSELGALHRRALERGGEFRLRHREQLTCERRCILAPR